MDVTGDAEIDIERVVVAVAELNDKISRLREEIDAFRHEEGSDPRAQLLEVDEIQLRRPAPSEFNDPTKNERRRTSGAQRNFKTDDSPPAGADLSARLSFAKREREVKATYQHEAAVFKEDYSPDDKSIGNDERPDRSRASKPSRTYRESISGAEKFGKETDEGAGAHGGLVGVSLDDDRSRKPDGCRDRFVHDDIEHCDRSLGNAIAPKIRRKRISRGVQYDVPIACERNNASYLFLSCFRSRSTKYRSTREAEEKRVPLDKDKPSIVHQARNQANKLTIKKIINDDVRPEQSCNSINKGETAAADIDLHGRNDFVSIAGFSVIWTPDERLGCRKRKIPPRDFYSTNCSK